MAAIPIINTKEDREQVLIALYKKAFPAVAKYVCKMGGSFEQAQDVFQDALVIYYEKVLSEAIILQSSEKAYLLGIAKHLWLNAYRDGANTIPLENTTAHLEPEDEEAIYASDKLMHYLQTAGQKCMEMLRAFYYDKLPVTHIANTFGYSGVRSATVQKYKCLERVRNTIKEKALHYEDFIK